MLKLGIYEGEDGKRNRLIDEGVSIAASTNAIPLKLSLKDRWNCRQIQTVGIVIFKRTSGGLSLHKPSANAKLADALVLRPVPRLVECFLCAIGAGGISRDREVDEGNLVPIIVDLGQVGHLVGGHFIECHCLLDHHEAESGKEYSLTPRLDLLLVHFFSRFEYL